MKALFCLYSAPLIESARTSSTPLAGNLRRGRVRGWQRNGSGGKKISLPLGQASQGQEFSSKHFLALPPRARERWGRLRLWCPALRKLSKRSRRESVPMPGKRKVRLWGEIGSDTTRSPPARCRQRENHPRAASWQSRAPSLCRSTPSPACWGFSISTTSPGILPTPRHDVPTLRGWRYPRSCTRSPETTLMAAPGRVGITGLGQINILVLFPPRPALPLARQTCATCEAARPGSLLPKNNCGGLCKAHHGS